MPVSCTCYFTLNINRYDTYEELEKILKFAIYNCNEMDADFIPNENGLEYD